MKMFFVHPLPAGRSISIVKAVRPLKSRPLIYFLDDAGKLYSTRTSLCTSDRFEASDWRALVALGQLSKAEVEKHIREGRVRARVAQRQHYANSAVSSLKRLGVPISKRFAAEVSRAVKDSKKRASA